MSEAWAPVHPDELAPVLERFAFPWWIAGGWAIDLALGRSTRAHDDVDVAVLRRDQRALFDALGGWDLRYADPAGGLEPWDGTPLELPVHVVWARPAATGPWLCELVLNEAVGDTWVFRRDARVTLPLARLGDRVLAPEVVLLYKAKAPGETDEADFAAALPILDTRARAWLRDALELCHPGHPWLARV